MIHGREHGSPNESCNYRQMKARDLFEMGAAPAAPKTIPGKPMPSVKPGERPKHPGYPNPFRRKLPMPGPMPKPKAAAGAPVAPPKEKPKERPKERPGNPGMPPNYPNPFRRKFPVPGTMPKPKACDTATKYESRASLIVKRLLA